MTEGHGDDLYKFGKEKIQYNFSSNVANPPEEITQGLHDYLFKNIDVIHNYPDPAPTRVEQKIASIMGINPSNVCVTNGATEAIYLIAQYLKGRNTYISEPTFREYRDACHQFSHSISKRFTSAIDTYWLCNPNNPTGEVKPLGSLRDLIQKFPDVTFVIDQSYEHFTRSQLMSATEGRTYPNLILIHSLTKHFAIPGLRLGYITGHPSIIKALRQLRMPWSVNSLAQEAALYLLSHKFPEKWFDNILDRAHRLSEELWELGIPQTASSTHYMLCRTPVLTAAHLKSWLVDNKGILIRDASNFKGLTKQHFRVASQGEAADKALCDAIKEWLNLFRDGK